MKESNCFDPFLQMIEEQKNLMNSKLEAKTKELEEVARQKQRNIQEKERLLKEIATCDQDMKETKMKLFAADADIIMEEYTEMEQAKELKALQLQLMRESEEYERPASSRVPRNGQNHVEIKFNNTTICNWNPNSNF